MTNQYNVESSIWVKFSREGIHCYPEAATNPELEDVSFLAHPHRHIFHFMVEVPVNDLNREIEFIQFKRWLESRYTSGTLQLDHKSCEMLAQDLAHAVLTKYPTLEYCKVDVSEDAENGASVKLTLK